MISNHEKWVVHKFGGTSVGNADCMRKCIDIIRPIVSQQRVAVVVSAMGGKPKVTDLLLDLVHAAASGRDDEIVRKMDDIHSKHQLCVNDILQKAPECAARIMRLIESDLKDISDLLRAVQLMRTPHEQILELVSGYGEIWSANIMTEAMQLDGQPFIFLNARDVLLVEEQETIGTKIFWEESEAKLSAYIAAAEEKFYAENRHLQFSNPNNVQLPHLMITGYIASSINGVATTLKRDGSDFSASIFGKMLKADTITIWTDVSGVYSADPRRVPDAQIIPNISYHEAIELAYFGAKVIHPKTMAPAIMSKIPIYIRNTFDPKHPGTRIFLSPYELSEAPQVSEKSSSRANPSRERSVCGFTTVDNICLLNIEGTGMIGVPGIAHRLFGALKNANISVMFIAQASSEHSICFATKNALASKAKAAIEEAFYYELKQQFITSIRLINDCSIIAAVGDSMSHMPGVSGLFFNALGGAKINVLSISQGCDERNISAVVYSKDATKALNAVHAAFWLSSFEITIGILGTGRVGSALLQTLIEQSQVLKTRFNLQIKIRGILNTRKMLLSEDLSHVIHDKLVALEEMNNSSDSNQKDAEVESPAEDGFPISVVVPNTVRYARSDYVKKSRSNLSLKELDVEFSTSPSPVATRTTTPVPNDTVTDEVVDSNLSRFLEHLQGGTIPHTILIDATTSHTIASYHPQWLKQGFHIVTANKRAMASNTLPLYESLLEAILTSQRMYMSEVTIGASLPIRTTLSDILISGDRVYSVVGIMSVSINTMLTKIYDEGKSFGQAIKETYQSGLFEDDPLVDLQGREAAEKLLILSRDLGYMLNLSDIEIEPLLSKNVPARVINWKNIEEEDFEVENALFLAKAQQAKAKNCTLRYVQRIECFPPAQLGGSTCCTSSGNVANGKVKATVRLEEVPLDSPHALVKGAVYHFSFHTERYEQNPLVVQGPLSDSANTASGMLGDILRIARSLGAKDRGIMSTAVYK